MNVPQKTGKEVPILREYSWQHQMRKARDSKSDGGVYSMPRACYSALTAVARPGAAA